MTNESAVNAAPSTTTSDGVPLRPAFTIAETLALLPISRNTLGPMLQTGRIRGLKVGSKWLVPRASIVAFLSGESQTSSVS